MEYFLEGIKTMDSKDIAIASMLQNQAKKILDYCKLDINDIFANIPSDLISIELETSDFNPSIDYDENIVYKVKKFKKQNVYPNGLSLFIYSRGQRTL